ncbi:MAG: DUF692 domain-containing protein [Pseudomonadota bacterium]
MTTRLPAKTGISLKPQHYRDIIEQQPDIGWLEVHPENYMGDGGLPHYYLSCIHQDYPISMHGVGLSLASSDGIDEHHLNALATVVKRHQPEQVSEHLAWSHWNSVFLNDLLPLPYTQEFLAVVVSNIHKVQDALQRTLLIENPSAYLGFKHSELSETEFLHAIVEQTGAGLLLDVNNVYVSANNQSYSAQEYIDNYPIDAIGEIHLAGHAANDLNGKTLLIDDHGSAPIDPVWDLFEYTLQRCRTAIPTLIEWDTNVPALNRLLEEATTAKQLMDKHLGVAA